MDAASLADRDWEARAPQPSPRSSHHVRRSARSGSGPTSVRFAEAVALSRARPSDAAVAARRSAWNAVRLARVETRAVARVVGLAAAVRVRLQRSPRGGARAQRRLRRARAGA